MEPTGEGGVSNVHASSPTDWGLVWRRWEPCGTHETPTGKEELRFKVDGLKEKDRLQFRVIAVNKGGESPPSDPSNMHTVKHKKRE